MVFKKGLVDLKINFLTSSLRKRGPCYSQVWPPTTAPPREPGTHTYQGEANKAALFFQITQIHTQASPTRLLKLSSLFSKCIGCTELSPIICMQPPIKGFQVSLCLLASIGKQDLSFWVNISGWVLKTFVHLHQKECIFYSTPVGRFYNSKFPLSKHQSKFLCQHFWMGLNTAV